MIITRTPYRVSLFGGGTDFPEWYLKNGGAVVSFAIDKYCYLSAGLLPPFFDHKYRVVYSQVETTKTIDDIRHPIVREGLRKYFPSVGAEIHHRGDLPARSGVGSSSAFAVGLIHSLKLLAGSDDTKSHTLAQDAIHLEQEVLKEIVGSQDQIACSYGGMNFIDFGNHSKGWNIQKIIISREQVMALEERMLLVYSGVSRSSSDVSKGLVQNFSRRHKELERIKQLAIECKSIISDGGDLDAIGNMLDESWHLKQLANPQSINPELESIYSKAKRCGALGGKVIGAGGGGFLLMWLPTNYREKFLETFRIGTVVPFQIDFFGSTCILNS